MVQLLWGKVPGQLGQQVVNVLDDGFVLINLSIPDVVQVLKGKGPGLDTEKNINIQ